MAPLTRPLEISTTATDDEPRRANEKPLMRKVYRVFDAKGASRTVMCE